MIGAMRVILASKSPRRRELLSQIGIEYECMVSEKEEKIRNTEPEAVVMELSRQKADDVYDMAAAEMCGTPHSGDEEPLLVIGADTVVSCGGEIMGKPKDREDAKRMLRCLSGGCHSVWTGVTVRYGNGSASSSETFAEETKVYMYDISDDELEEYVSCGEPDDKAGSYAIQGRGARFVEKIEGDYNNVVGLPAAALYQRLKNINL